MTPKKYIGSRLSATTGLTRMEIAKKASNFVLQIALQIAPHNKSITWNISKRDSKPVEKKIHTVFSN